jgi:hypothetical protein
MSRSRYPFFENSLTADEIGLWQRDAQQKTPAERELAQRGHLSRSNAAHPEQVDAMSIVTLNTTVKIPIRILTAS